MIPSQMKDFSQSLIAVSFFASNILFWRESGYFDAAAEEKPLLHTWSLAVEEQYYVLFPIFLILVWRFGKNRVFWIIVVIAAISLLLSEWGWHNKATAANFYLAPTRAWELFAGSIAAFVVQKRGVQKNNLLAMLGLAAIIFSIFAYDENTPFPGVYALVPVLGVVFLILFADKETLVARILSTKAFVGIGLISYSAYLWHQPLFAFVRIKLLSVPSELVMLTLCSTSIFLAFLSWKFIEKPFRQRDSFTRTQIFSLSAFGVVIFVAFGLTGHLNNGIHDRLDGDVKSRFYEIENLFSDRLNLIKSGICHFRGRGKFLTFHPFLNQWNCVDGRNASPRIAVFGDSHAADKAAALLLNGFNLTRLGGNSCNLNPKGFQKKSHCLPLIKRFQEELSQNQYDFLILANLFDSPSELEISNLESIINFWSDKADEIILFSPMIEFENFDKLYIQHGSSVKTSYDETLHKQFYRSLEAISLPKNFSIVNTKEIFCAITSANCLPLKDNQPLLVDYGHLSRQGAQEFGLILHRTLRLDPPGTPSRVRMRRK